MKNPFEEYFLKPQKSDYVVKPAAINTIDTFNDICTRFIPQSVEQTQYIAREILDLTEISHTTVTDETIAFRIYKFVTENIRYKLDRAGFEQIRMPSKLWADGFGDCEDFTILCSSILINLDVPHTIRMADYGDGWQHIYIKIGKITLDPVDATFNHEDLGRYYDYHIDPKVIKKAKRWESDKMKGLGRIGIDPNEARKAGKFVENGIEFERQNPKIVGKYMLKGRDCKVSFSLDLEVDAYYALIPALILQPSHIGNIENPHHFIPDAQPRNRAMSNSGANIPQLMAEKLRPSEICEGSTAYSGTPIVNERGEVIQGNGRAYAMKYYWQHFTTDKQGYMNYLVDHAMLFGFDKHPSKIYFHENLNKDFFKSFMYVVGRGAGFGVSSPVLVRVVPCSDAEAIRLGQFKQSDLEAVATRTNDIKSKVALVTPKLLDDILRTVFGESASTEESISELIRSSNISSILVRNKIFRSDEFTENYLNFRTGELNADGVRVITDLIVGLIFKGADTNTPELFHQLPDRVQTAIAKSAKFILGTDTKNSLSVEVSKAIRGTINYLQYKDAGNSFKAWTSQTSIFGKNPTEEYSPIELVLIKLFGDAPNQKIIVDVFRQYFYQTTDEVRTGIAFTDEPPRKAKSREVAIEKVFQVAPAKVTVSDYELKENQFVEKLVADFSNGVKHNKLSLEKLSKQFGIEKPIHIKELTELAIVKSARRLASNPILKTLEKYKTIVELYQSQPNSSLRTSDSILFQQYSTPTPIAYLMGKYCQIDLASGGESLFYEPSAGNGVLTIAAKNTRQFDVNELSPYRVTMLKKQNFANVTQVDASKKNNQIEKKYKAVLTNPPFGKLDDKTSIDGYAVGNLDHLMTITALNAMQDDGRAAIIIGGNTIWDSEGRLQAGKNRIFLSYLYSHYEVDDIINVDGKYLYSRQGTGFNVRIILISGRKQKIEGYAPLFNEQTDKQVKDFDTLYKRFLHFLSEQNNSSRAKEFALKYKYRLRLQIQEYELQNANTEKD